MNRRVRAPGRRLLLLVPLFALLLAGCGGSASDEAKPVPTPAMTAADDTGELRQEGRVLGEPSAPVKVVEYSDYRCPWCGRFTRETEPQIRQEYVATGLVQLEFRNMVIEGEPSALAAEAAECASEQGRFWDYHDILYKNQQAFDAGVLKAFGQQLGLDQAAFDECLDSHRHRQLVIDETQEGRDAGVRGTPSFFINGEYVRGYRSFADFQPLIEGALEKAR